MKMKYCIVKNCLSNETCLVSFHQLPPVLCNQWKKVIDRGDAFVPKKTHRICNLHFSSANFTRNVKKNRLKKGAVPTLDPEKSELCVVQIFYFDPEPIWLKVNSYDQGPKKDHMQSYRISYTRDQAKVCCSKCAFDGELRI